MMNEKIYLENNGIYYAKDLFLTSLDLFLYPLDDFIRKFEVLKEKLGADFAKFDLGLPCF